MITTDIAMVILTSILVILAFITLIVYIIEVLTRKK